MKIERKYMAHFLNAAFGSGTASYCRLGNDLEEYSPELSANVEKKNNILGQTSVTIDSYQKQGEVAPYYAEKNDPLFEKLQAIIDGDLTLDNLKPTLWRLSSGAKHPPTPTRPSRRNATSRSSAMAAIPLATRSPLMCIIPA